jgi:hypothetical protein
MQDDLDYITITEACRIMGGDDKPVNPATVYRGVKAGRISPPDHPSPGISRFRRGVFIADLKRGRASKTEGE